MKKLNGWVVGGALAITLAVLYTICALAFALAPQATLEFFNAWFHGLNLTGMQGGAKPFTIGLFIYGLAGLAATSFVAGALFALVYGWLTPARSG